MTFEIVCAVDCDLAAVQDCAAAAYAPYIPAIGRPPAPMQADFAGHLSRSELWVAKVAGRVAGYIVFAPQDDHMFLENVAVYPDFAGRGIGKALIAFCETTARHAGLTRVRVYTNEKMVANLSLYPRLGYIQIGRGIEDGFHRVYFEKTLSD